MGLSVPQITRVFNRLKALGLPIEDDVYTVEYGKKLIMKLIGKQV